jgi:hypothetical protein
MGYVAIEISRYKYQIPNRFKEPNSKFQTHVWMVGN